MTVFVDSGVFYAHADRAANRHDTAQEALSEILRGEYGQPCTSDYVYDESVTLTLARTGDHGKAVTVGQRIRGDGAFPSLVHLHHVNAQVFDEAIAIFEQYDDQRLSVTDATTVAMARHHDIDHVLAFDDDFDGLVDRLDPETVAERNP
jgi:predicted nucleic acid-binding protein